MVTYNVSDSQANAAPQVLRTVRVEDTTAPAITLTGASPQFLECPESYTELGATAVDACDGDLSASIVIDASAVDATTPGNYQVTYNVSDAANNAATEVVRMVTVRDTTAPVIALLGDNPLTLELNTSYVEPGATAEDTCAGDLSGQVVIDSAAVDTTTVGNYQVTYNVNDGNGNDATQVVRTVRVQDSSAPTITLLGENPLLIECNGTYMEAGATASDPGDGDLTSQITIDSSAVNSTMVGTYQVSYTVTDSTSQTTTIFRTVTVQDTVAPVITLVGDNPLTLECPQSYNEPGATATDDCDQNLPAITIDGSAVDASTPGTYQVTYNVADASSNAATQVVRTVIVQDTTAPVITLNGSATVTFQEGGSYTEEGASVSDACDLSLTTATVGGDVVDPTTAGTYRVTYDATDASNNVATQVVRTVTVTATPIYNIAANATSVAETDAGTVPVTFTVTRSDGGGLGSVDWNVALTGGLDASDLVTSSGVIDFAGGQTSQTLTVQVNGDLLVEPDENLTVTLSNPLPSNTVLGTATAQTTITNDDSAVVSIADASALEATGALAFTVTSSAAVQGGFTINAATALGVANETDFATAGETLTFEQNGALIQDFTVTVIEDAVVERDENFTVTLDTLSANGLDVTVTTASATGTITNDDVAEITITDVEQAEGSNGAQTAFTFTLTLDQATDQSVTVNAATGSNGTATPGIDFTALSETVTFAGTAGENETVTVLVNADQAVEPTETIELLLSNLQAGGRAVTLARTSATATVTNDDGATLTITDASAPEALGQLTFTVTLNEEVDDSFTVDFATTTTVAEPNVGAQENDFTAQSGTLTFQGDRGETQEITVAIANDTTVERDESFQVILSNLQGATDGVTIADSAGLGTIENDDRAMLTLTNARAMEGESATFTVTLDQAVDAEVTVDFTIDGDTSDLATLTGGTLIFPAGSTAPQEVMVGTRPDEVVELAETFTLSLDNLQSQDRDVAMDRLTATGTIENDDAATITLTGSSSVAEGAAGGMSQVTYTVTLDGQVDIAPTLDFFTVNGTAQAGSDFIGVSNTTLTFPVSGQGTQQQSQSVTITGDDVIEADETFLAALENLQVQGRNVILAVAETPTTIINDDRGTLTITDATVTEGAAGETPSVTLTVTSSTAIDSPFSVGFSTSDGTATSGQDFSAQSGRLTFTGIAGEQETITLEVLGDDLVELNETFVVTLGALDTTVAITNITALDGTGTVTLIEDDSAAITVADVSELEGDNGQTAFVFTATLDNAVDTSVTLDLATALPLSGDAADAADLVEATETLTFQGTAGEQQTFTVQVNGDEVLEANEIFTLNVAGFEASGRNVSPGPSIAATGTIRNDDGAALAIANATATEGDDLTFIVSSNDAVQGGFMVDYTVTLDTAEATDLTVQNGTLTFDGTAQEEETITLSTLADEIVENDETVLVTLSNVRRGTTNLSMDLMIADGEGRGTILDDDALALTVAPAQATEGQDLTFTLTSANAVEGGFALDAATAAFVTDASLARAENGVDFTDFQDRLVFTGTAGETLEVTVPTTADAIVERDENVLLELSNVSGQVSDLVLPQADAFGTILNDDTATITVAEVRQAEGTSGQNTTVTFDLTLDAEVDVPVSLTTASLATGTAVLGEDFLATEETITFSGENRTATGETLTVDVEVIADTIVEPDEVFTLVLANLQADGRDVTLARESAQATLVNDDTATLAIADVLQAEGNSGTTDFTFTLRLDAPVQGGFTANVFSDLDASAANPADLGDFATGRRGIAFQGTAGETATFTVSVRGDEVVEADETFAVRTQAGSPRVPVTDSITFENATGTILNDDQALIGLELVDAQEGDGQNTTTNLRVTLSRDVDVPINVFFSTESGSATVGVDFQGVAQDLTVTPAGVDVPLTILPDNIAEGSETLTVLLNSLMDGNRDVLLPDALASLRATLTILDDDAAPVLAAETPVYVLDEDQTLIVDAANGLLLGADDLDDGAENLTVTGVVTSPDNGTLVVAADGSFNFKPEADFAGDNSFTFSVSDGTNIVTGTAVLRVERAVDIALSLAVLESPVIAGGDPRAIFQLTATNNGPSDATGVIIRQTDVLPPGVTLTGVIPSQGAFTRNDWTLDLADGENATLTFSLQAAANLSSNQNAIPLTLRRVQSDQPDRAVANDLATATVALANNDDISIVVVTETVLNPQNGLFQSEVTVTNNTGSEVAGFRLFVFGLPGDVVVANATGNDGFQTLPAGTPYLLSNGQLNDGESRTLTVEFLRPSLDRNFAAQYAVELLPVAETTAPGAGATDTLSIGRVIFREDREGRGEVLLEFATVPGRRYAVEYSDDNMRTFQRIAPSFEARANRTQYLDNGLPKTPTRPRAENPRFYRYLELP